MDRDAGDSFAHLLQRHRIQSGLTQEELAERAAVSTRAVSDLERGVKTRPRAYTVHQLAEALRLSPDERAVFARAARAHALSSGRHPAVGVAETARPEGQTATDPRMPVGAYLGAAPAGPLVARDAERHALAALLDAVAAHHGRLVLLAGEPGAGKTRLAQEAALLASARGFLCAVGRCYAPDTDTGAPFTPVLDSIGTLYAACPPGLRAEVPSRWPYLTWLLPEAGLPPPPPREGPDDRPRLFRAVAGFLQALAAQRPVAVLLDDLHWADDASLALLAHLARQTPAHRVLLLGTVRAGAVGRRHRLAALLRDLEREGLLARIAVRPLDAEGTAALLAALLDTTALPAGLVAYVYRLSEGNPFFIRHLLRSLQEHGAVAPREGVPQKSSSG